MRLTAPFGFAHTWRTVASLLVFALFMGTGVVHAQDDGGDKKEKKEKPEKPPKEKKEKAEKPPKAEKEKPAKPEKAPKEKKEKEAKKSDKEDDAPIAEEDGDEDEGGDEGGDKKKKKKKGKKGDDEEEDPAVQDGTNTANESFHANQADGSVKHGRAVPCARYRRGSMEFIDKNTEFVYIKRTRNREIYSNQNRGIRALKVRKLTRDQKIDKSKAKTKTDRHGKIKDKGNKLVFKIEWTEDCKYTLTFKRSKKPTKFEKGWKMDCIVTKCYEDYYDCDCDLNAIIQYYSIRKTLTKAEIAAKQREAYEDSVSKARAEAAVAAEQQAKIDEEVRKQAQQDEIFAPIKRIQDGNISDPGADGGKEPEQTRDPNGKSPNPTEGGKGQDNGGATGSKTPKPPKGKEPDAGEDEAKEDKAPKEKEVKEPKEKEVKEPKEKEAKEPKEKAPKEPKEKEAKAPKEKTPKEPKEKAAKEPKEKAPKEPKEKAPKEPKEKKPKDEE